MEEAASGGFFVVIFRRANLYCALIHFFFLIKLGESVACRFLSYGGEDCYFKGENMTKRFLLWVSLLAFSFLPCTGQAQEANDSAAKQALQENWADAPRSLDERLFDAAVGGEAEAVRQFLQEGADPNAQSCQTHCDVLENCTETEEQNCIIGCGQLCGTPLFSASVGNLEKLTQNRGKIIQLLVGAGADPDIRGCYLPNTESKMCFSPLAMVLADKNGEESVRLLLESGADVTDYRLHHTFRRNEQNEADRFDSDSTLLMSAQMQRLMASYADDSKSAVSVLSFLLRQKSPDPKAVRKLASKEVIPELKKASVNMPQEVQWTLAKNATEETYRNALLKTLLIQRNPNSKAVEKLLKEGAALDEKARIASGDLSAQTQQTLAEYAEGRETSVLSLILTQPNPDLSVVKKLFRDGADVSSLSSYAPFFRGFSAQAQQIVARYCGDDDAALAFVMEQKDPDEDAVKMLLKRNAALSDKSLNALERYDLNLQNLLAGSVQQAQSREVLMRAFLSAREPNAEGIKILLDKGTAVPVEVGRYSPFPGELQNEIAEYIQNRDQKDRDAWLAFVLDLDSTDSEAVKTLVQSGADLTTVWSGPCRTYHRNQKLEKIQKLIGKSAFQKSGLKTQPVSNVVDCAEQYMNRLVSPAYCEY